MDHGTCISTRHSNRWEPPEMFQNMQSGNLKASISEENETEREYSGQSLEILGSQIPGEAAIWVGL
jgi:hypothetical protein